MTHSFYFCVSMRSPDGSPLAHGAEYEGKSNKPATLGVLKDWLVFEGAIFKCF
jgi:hypothetical protein